MAAISIFIAASHCFLRHLWSKSVHERQKSKIPMQLSTYFEQRILNFGLLCDFGRKRALIQEYQFWRWCHIKPVLMKWGHKTKEWTPLRWEPSIFQLFSGPFLALRIPINCVPPSPSPIVSQMALMTLCRPLPVSLPISLRVSEGQTLTNILMNAVCSNLRVRILLGPKLIFALHSLEGPKQIWTK